MQVSAQYFPSQKTVLTGNPRAQTVARIKNNNRLSSFGLDSEKKTVLIFGGSQGALKINHALMQALPSLTSKSYQILYVSGERYYELFLEDCRQSPKKLKNVKIVPYIFQMQEILANVDLVVSRAGATSIAEFTALGLPVILIPSPNVTNDHQTKNAQELVSKGAAWLIKDDQLTGMELVQKIDRFFADSKLQNQMRQASLSCGHIDAAEKLFDLTKNLVRNA